MHGCSSAYRASEVTVMPRKGVLLGISGAIRLGRPLPTPSHGFSGRRRGHGLFAEWRSGSSVCGHQGLHRRDEVGWPIRLGDGRRGPRVFQIA